MKRKIITFLVLLFAISVFAGGPWTAGKKHGFAQIQATFPIRPYNKLFLYDGSTLELNRGVTDVSVQAYLEYGLGDKLSIVAAIPYKFVSTDNDINTDAEMPLLSEGSLSGFGNFEFALKYQFLDRFFVSSFSIKADFNTGKQDIAKGLTTGFDASGYSLFWYFGKGFSSRFYSFFETGYTLRTNDYSDNIRLMIETGYMPANDFWLALVFDFKKSMYNGNYYDENLRQTGLYTNNQEFFAYGLKASYELKSKIGFSASTFGALWGNYVAHSITINIGIYQKW